MTGTQGTARTATGRTVARRTVVAAAGAVGLGAALVACGSDDDASDAAAETPAGDGGADDGANGDSGAAGKGEVLAKTSDIPEGGGKVFEDKGVVVTQPTAGEFKAFSSVCTHSGCTVGDISNGTITCPCHGSQFDAANGSVKKGPANKPLGAASITVEGDSITLA
ncbi:iron-sulfur protein [Streptomyces camponoticapitis]|uniref:Cytochrome bc1 complex Rieske iron-sulfur subunit n=1 Tax=Streptomyces camponoticapitis TaxID=1616125 RepID=A0ABQ2EWF0_9ACTN|nr:Rieske (2Fe-2S) protein [Streptomyces camponoticapitis]GGK29699.1 iron-sulfur protein [Streptomyces camponoticapitis]